MIGRPFAMSVRALSAPLCLAVLLGCGAPPRHPAPSKAAGSIGKPTTPRTVECQVLIAGGSTAALAAALAAAQEFDAEDAAETAGVAGVAGAADAPRRVCLLEPTNWPGGQLTAAGVAAVDFDHHTKAQFGERLNLGTLVANQAFVFARWMQVLGSAPEPEAFRMLTNRGRCWVSVRCYEPQALVDTLLATLRPYVERGRLQIFFSTVVKRVSTQGRRITAVQGIVRTPRDAEEKGTWDERSWETGVWPQGAFEDVALPAHARRARQGTYGRRLSDVIENWYAPADDALYTKEIVTFKASGRGAMVIEATEGGEVLALSDARYEMGSGQDGTCGQALVFPLALTFGPDPWVPTAADTAAQREVTPAMKALYSHRGAGGSWDTNWRYRRMRAAFPSPSAWHTPPGLGDITQINANAGNDYTLEYGLLAAAEARSLVRPGRWNGGFKTSVLRHAETHSLGYGAYLRAGFPAGKAQALAEAQGQPWQADYERAYAVLEASHIAPSGALGTAHGLSKMPYLRDSRRSVGLAGYQLSYERDLLPGTKPAFPLGIGVYTSDVHAVAGCPASAPEDPHPRPFYIPFAALTNASFDNLLVAGKTMAQDFPANAATRLHPIEFASGTAAGVTAAVLYRNGMTPAQALADASLLGALSRRIAARHGPTEWAR